MRRYVESAARHFGVGGYVINIDDENDTDSGAVFGEAWVCDDHLIPQLKGFATWIRGEWVPAVYTNIKPTPVGTAYPEKATVEQYAVQTYHENVAMDHFDRFSQFTMFLHLTMIQEASLEKRSLFGYRLRLCHSSHFFREFGMYYEQRGWLLERRFCTLPRSVSSICF